jgi:hypothetical protein
MTSYKQFCERFRLNPASQDARDQFEKAQANLRALYSVSAEDQAQEAIDKAQRTSRNQEGEQ